MVFSANDKAIIEACHKEKGWSAYRICREFPTKRWIRRSVSRLINKIDNTGTTDRKPGSGRPRTSTSEEVAKQVEDLIQSQDSNPGTHSSQRIIASQLAVSQSAIKRIAKRLKLKAFRRLKVSCRDTNVRKKRKIRCRKLYQRFNKDDVKRIVFTDEKDFTVEIAKNHQNDRVYGRNKSAINPNRLYRETSRFSKKVMVSAGISWRGKTRIHIVESKLNTVEYIKLLDDGLIPDCFNLYPEHDFVLQQDGATCHTSNATQNHLQESVPAFIKKDEWPPQSPDCNPMDYCIWDILSRKVYNNRMEKFTEEELKRRIVECWEKITLREIQKAIASWKKRLWKVYTGQGGHIEHLLK